MTYSFDLYLSMRGRNPTKTFRENSSWELGLRFLGPTRRALKHGSKTFFAKKMKIAGLIFCPNINYITHYVRNDKTYI